MAQMMVFTSIEERRLADGGENLCLLVVDYLFVVFLSNQYVKPKRNENSKM